ncbi:hypothetical protein [Actinomadura sp. NPDC000600]|uniref:hypothetical protein n=1 Tax=Actinomadura sp. NPDC000600 TaxID=3154262 RepID=UPI003399C703
MRVLYGAWSSAILVCAVGFGALIVLEPADTGDDLDQVLRVHLPWVVANFLMGWAAGVYTRNALTGPPRILAVLAVPLVATVAGLAFAVPRTSSALGVVLHFIETLFGVAVGLAMARGLSRTQEDLDVPDLEPGWEGFYDQALPPDTPAEQVPGTPEAMRADAQRAPLGEVTELRPPQGQGPRRPAVHRPVPTPLREPAPAPEQPRELRPPDRRPAAPQAPAPRPQGAPERGPGPPPNFGSVPRDRQT